MVRETRYLLVGNLPDKVTEDDISEQFQRYGKIQSVRLHEKKEGEDGSSATVAFADIKSASKAHNGEITIEGKLLVTEYSEGSATGSAVTRTREVAPTARPAPAAFNHPRVSNTYPNRTKGTEEGEVYDNRDFHYGAPRGGGDQAGFDNRYTANYSESGQNQRGRPRERFFNRGGYKGGLGQRQFGHRHHAEGIRQYDQSGVDRDFERPKNPPSPTHSLSQSSRHSSSRKNKGSRSNSRSRSRSNSSSSSSYSRSSSASSDSGSGSHSSHSSCPSSVQRQRLPSTATIPQVKSHRTESQDSTNSEKTGDIDPNDKRPHGVCITGLPLRSSDTSLRDGLFHEYKKYGKVNAVQVAGQSDDRFAIVSFKKPEDAEKALEASHEKKFFGSVIKVMSHEGIADTEDNEFRPPEAELDEYHPKATRTLFVGNLEKDITNQELRERFSEYGEIIDIDVKRQGAVSAYAFVQYFDITSVVKSLKELEGQTIGSMKIKLGFGKSMPTNCIWLDNVAETVSENFLCRQFSRYGNVSHGIIDKQSGKGLVYFTNMEAAQFALNEMRNRILNGKKIITDFASRDCQNRFFEKMEKSGQLQPGQRPDERRGWTPRQPGQEGQWEGGRSRSNFRQFNNRGMRYHRGNRTGNFRGRGQNFKEKFSEEFRRQRSYDEYSQGSTTPYPEGEDSFEQDLRAYSHSQRERREADGSQSPSQFSDEMYSETYRQREGKDGRYGDRYGTYGDSPEGGHVYSEDTRYEYSGKGRSVDNYYSQERYMSGRDKDQSPPPGEYGRGYSPEGQSWSRSPSYNRQHKDNYGRHTPPTPLGDEIQDFSSRDHSPMDMEDTHHHFGDYKSKSSKPDDFDICEADIEELRSSYQHKKEPASVRSEARYVKKRTYDDSFSREHPQYDETNRKFERHGGRTNAEFKRDLLKNVQRIQSEISDKKSRMVHKDNSSPNSSSSTDSEHGSLNEGELSNLQHEKLLLLEKLKQLEKEGSTSDNESNELEDTRKVVSKRPRLDTWVGKGGRLHSELGSVIVGPRKTHSDVYEPFKPADITQSYRKQMEAYRKTEEQNMKENLHYKDVKTKTVMMYDSEGEEVMPTILSPKEMPSSFIKKRKKYDGVDDKRSYRAKKGEDDEHPSSDNDESKNFNRTDSIASLRRLSSGHSSPRTPVTSQSVDHHRYSESDLSASEGHVSSNSRKNDTSRKISDTDNHENHLRRSRKDDHQPIIIPLGDDIIVPNAELRDPRQEKPISDEPIFLPLPKFASFTPPLMPVLLHQDSPKFSDLLKNDSPCFSPPSSGSKNQSPEMSPSDSNSQESLGLPKPPEGYVPPSEEEEIDTIPGEEGGEVPPSDENNQEKKPRKESEDLSDSSDFNDLTEGLPDAGEDISLEERIRRLDEKLNRPAPPPTTKMSNDQLSPLSLPSALSVTTNTATPMSVYSKYKIRKKQDSTGSGTGDSKAEPSEIMRTVLSRSSIFDQDSKRLEQINEKYCPKSVNVSVDENPKSITIRTKAAAKEMPLSTLPGSLAGRLGNSSSSFPTISINTSLANQSSPQNTYLSPSSDASPVSPFPTSGFSSQDHLGIADSNSTASTDNYCDIPSLTNISNEPVYSNKSVDSIGDGLNLEKDSLSEFPKLTESQPHIDMCPSLDNNVTGQNDNFSSKTLWTNSKDSVNVDMDLKAGQDHSNFMECSLSVSQPVESSSGSSEISKKLTNHGNNNLSSAVDSITPLKGEALSNSVNVISLSSSVIAGTNSDQALITKEHTDKKSSSEGNSKPSGLLISSTDDSVKNNEFNLLGKRKVGDTDNNKEMTEKVTPDSEKVNSNSVEGVGNKEKSSTDSPEVKKARISEEDTDNSGSNSTVQKNKTESSEKKEKEKKDKNKDKKRDKVDGDVSHKDKTDKKDKDKDGKDKDKTGSSKTKVSSVSGKGKDSTNTDGKSKDGTSSVKKDKTSEASSHKHKSSKSKDKSGKEGHIKKAHSSDKKEKTGTKTEGDITKTCENDVDKQDKGKSKEGHSGKDSTTSKEGQTDKVNSHTSKKKDTSNLNHSSKSVKDFASTKTKEEGDCKEAAQTDSANHKNQDGKDSPDKSSTSDSSKHKAEKTDTTKHKSENKHKEKSGETHKHKDKSDQSKHKVGADNSKHKDKSSNNTDNSKHKDKSAGDVTKHKEKSSEAATKHKESKSTNDSVKHKGKSGASDSNKHKSKDGEHVKHKENSTSKDGEHVKHKENSMSKDGEQSKSIEKSSSLDSESSVKHKDKTKTSGHDKTKHKQENKHKLESSSSKDKSDKASKEKSSSSKLHKSDGKVSSQSDGKIEKQKSLEQHTNKSKTTDTSEGNKKSESSSNSEGKPSEQTDDKSKEKTTDGAENKNEKHRTAEKSSHSKEKQIKRSNSDKKSESDHQSSDNKKEEKKKSSESLKSSKPSISKKNSKDKSVTKPDIEANKPPSKEKTKKSKKEVAKSKEISDKAESSSKKEKKKEETTTATTPKQNDVDDFDWAAWAEPYESMYDKVKRRSNEKGKQIELERDMKKGLGKLQQSRSKKLSKFSDIDDTGESSLSSDDSSDHKSKPVKKTIQSKEVNKKKKGILDIISSSDNDEDDDDDDSQAFLKSFHKPSSKPSKEVKGFPPGKKASILDIYSSDSEEDELSSDSFKKIVKKKESTAESSEDYFDSKHKKPKTKKNLKKDKTQSTKKVLKKQKSVVSGDSDDDLDSDINFNFKPKSQLKTQKSKSKSKTEKTPQKVVRKIFSSSSDSETDEDVVPEIKNKKVEKEPVIEKVKPKKVNKKTPLSILNSDSDDVHVPQVFAKHNAISTVTAQTISECDIDDSSDFTKKKNKEKSTKKGRKKDNILVSEGKLEIGKQLDKKDEQKIGLFEKMETFIAQSEISDSTQAGSDLNESTCKKEKHVKNSEIESTKNEKKEKSGKSNAHIKEKTDNLFDSLKPNKKQKKELKKSKKQKSEDTHKKAVDNILHMEEHKHVDSSLDFSVSSDDGHLTFKSPAHKKEDVVDMHKLDNTDNGHVHFPETEIAAECSISDGQDTNQGDVVDDVPSLTVSTEESAVVSSEFPKQLTDVSETETVDNKILEINLPDGLQGIEVHNKKKGKKKKKDKKDGESKKSKKKDKDKDSLEESSTHKKEKKKKKSESVDKSGETGDKLIGLACLEVNENEVLEEQTTLQKDKDIPAVDNSASETSQATAVLENMYGGLPIHEDVSMSSPPYQPAPLLDPFSKEETVTATTFAQNSGLSSSNSTNENPQQSQGTVKASTPVRTSQDETHSLSFMSPNHSSNKDDTALDSFTSNYSNKKSLGSSSHEESHGADIFDFTEDDDDSDILSPSNLRKRMAVTGERRKSSSISLSCSDTELPHSKDTPRKTKTKEHKDNETSTPKTEKKSKKKHKDTDLLLMSPSREDKQKDTTKNWIDLHTEKTDASKAHGIGLGVKVTPSILETTHDDDKLLTFDEPLFGFYKSTYDFPPKPMENKRSLEDKTNKTLLSPPICIGDATESGKKKRKKRKSKSNSSTEEKEPAKNEMENILSIDTQQNKTPEPKPLEPLLSPIQIENKKTEEEVLRNIEHIAEKLQEAGKSQKKSAEDEESNRAQTQEAVSSLENWSCSKPTEANVEVPEPEPVKPADTTDEVPAAVEPESDPLIEQAEDETALAIQSILPLDEKTGEFVLPDQVSHSREPTVSVPTTPETTVAPSSVIVSPVVQTSTVALPTVTSPTVVHSETTPQLLSPPRTMVPSPALDIQQPEMFSPPPPFSSPQHSSVHSVTPLTTGSTSEDSLLSDSSRPELTIADKVLPATGGKKAKGSKARKTRTTKAQQAAQALATAEGLKSPETQLNIGLGANKELFKEPVQNEQQPIVHQIPDTIFNRTGVLGLPLGQPLGQPFGYQFGNTHEKEANDLPTPYSVMNSHIQEQPEPEVEPAKEEKRVTRRRSKQAKDKDILGDKQPKTNFTAVEDVSQSQGELPSFNRELNITQANSTEDISELGSQELSDVDKDEYDQNRLVMDESGYPPSNESKTPRSRRGRKPKNYKEMNSGVLPRTTSPRSRTSPRSPRNVASPKQSTSPKLQSSPKSEIPSPIVKIERLPMPGKNFKKDVENAVEPQAKDSSKKITRSSVLQINQRLELEPKETEIAEYTIEPSHDTNKGAANIFDFDASESELKVEPVTVKRRNPRRKKTTDSQDASDKEMHITEKEPRPEEARVRSLSTESEIKMVIRTPRGSKTPRVTKHPARPEIENIEVLKPRQETESSCKGMKSPEIQPPVVSTVEVPVTFSSKPIVTTAIEQSVKQPVAVLPTIATSKVEETIPPPQPEVSKSQDIQVNKKVEKVIEPIVESKPDSDMSPVTPLTPATPMSNIDRIIDNVSKGIFEWNDLDDPFNKAPVAPVHEGVLGKKKMSARSHSAESVNAVHSNAGTKLIPGKGIPAAIPRALAYMAHSEGRLIDFMKESGHHGVLTSAVSGITIATTTFSDSLAKTGLPQHSPLPGFYTDTSGKSRQAEVAVTFSTTQAVSHHSTQSTVSPAARKPDDKHDKGHLQQVPPYHTSGSAVTTTPGMPRQQMVPNENVNPQGGRFQPPISEHLPKHSKGFSVVSDHPTLTSSTERSPLMSTPATAPTCVVHPITTTAFSTKHDGIKNPVGMSTSVTTTTSAMTGMPIATSMSQQDLVKQDLVKEQIRAMMSGQPFHPPDRSEDFALNKKQQEMNSRNSSGTRQNPPVSAHQGRENPPQRPPSAHSQHLQKGGGDQLPPRPGSAHEKVPPHHPSSIQEQLRLQLQRGKPFFTHGQVPQHMIPFLQQAQAEADKKMAAEMGGPVDLQKVSSPSVVQKGAVIAASAATSQGPSPHPQIRSPALAQTAPSPHQITQRPSSPTLHKQAVEKSARWSEAGVVDGRAGNGAERSRPSGDLLMTQREPWIYGAPGLMQAHPQQEQGMNLTTVQQPSPVPRETRESTSSRLQQHQHHLQEVSRQQAEASRHQAELEYQQQVEHEQDLRQKQDWKRQHAKQHQQEIQRQQEMLRQQQIMQQHKEQLIQQRDGNSTSNPATSDSRQTALIQGHPRTSVSTSHSDAKAVSSMDPVLAQHGLYHDLRRPGSQGIGAFTPPVSGSELSPGIPAAPHIYNTELQRLGMMRMPMIDPHHIYSQHGNPHYIHSHIAQRYMQHVQPDSLPSTERGHGPPHSSLPSPTGRPLSQSGSKHGSQDGISPMPSRPLSDPSPGGEGSLLSLLQRYPVMWQGVLALKNDSSVVQMHLISGFQQLVKLSLPQQAQDGTVQPLRIAQRMRLEPAQLDGVVKRMQFEKDFCMLLALPCGRDHGDIINQTRAMSSGFIQYLQQKQAAGIVNVADPGSQQPAYVVHIFPPCEFSHGTLGRVGFDLMHQVRDLSHLLVIITTVA